MQATTKATIPLLLPVPVESARVKLESLTLRDAKWVLALLNEPSFIEFIGDKQVRSEADAKRYLQQGPLHSYQQYGVGLCKATRTDTNVPIGMVGLLQRDYLTEPDLGYALFPEHSGQGLAYEAAQLVLATTPVAALSAIVNANNEPSIKLLQKLGFVHAGKLTTPEQQAVQHYRWTRPKVMPILE